LRTLTLSSDDHLVNPSQSPSESSPVNLSVLLVLTFTTGIVDAVSVLGFGHIFTANMTGNIVFLGFALAGAPGFSIERSFAALLAFLCGALAGGRMANQMASQAAARWAGQALIIESVSLFCAGLTMLWLAKPAQVDSAPFLLAISLTAIAMGFRNATVRKLAVPDLTTTVLTLTLTGLAADSHLAGGANPRWQRRLGSVLAMFGGAIAGAMVLRWSAAVALFICAMTSLACAFVILQKRNIGVMRLK
jgi:uncharacterized membrane protein YoaK (UPF0700 family)